MDDDHGAPISYHLLARGTVVAGSDGVEVGSVERVIDNPKEHIFDGIIMRVEGGELLWVDAPEVARITERRVSLTIDGDEARALPPCEVGAPEYVANPGGGRLSRLFGGDWKRRRH